MRVRYKVDTALQIKELETLVQMCFNELSPHQKIEVIRNFEQVYSEPNSTFIEQYLEFMVGRIYNELYEEARQEKKKAQGK